MPEARSGSRRPGAALYGLKPSWGRVPVVIRPNAFAGTDPFVAEGPITRTVADAALALQSLAGFDARDPYSLAGVPDFVGSLGGDLRGVRIAYSPDFGVYPVDPRIATVVAAAARAFEAAGAIVEEVAIPIPFDQRELSDLWCRLITPLNIETFEAFKADGLDLRRDHRDSFPPEYLRWIDAGYGASVTDRRRDQLMRTEVCDVLAGVFATYDFIVTPTVGAVQVPNATDGNTMGPTRGGRGRGGSADRLVPDLPPQLLRPSGRLDPGRPHRWTSPGRSPAHRPARRRRRRPAGELGLRADPAVG